MTIGTAKGVQSWPYGGIVPLHFVGRPYGWWCRISYAPNLEGLISCWIASQSRFHLGRWISCCIPGVWLMPMIRGLQLRSTKCCLNVCCVGRVSRAPRASCGKSPHALLAHCRSKLVSPIHWVGHSDTLLDRWICALVYTKYSRLLIRFDNKLDPS